LAGRWRRARAPNWPRSSSRNGIIGRGSSENTAPLTGGSAGTWGASWRKSCCSPAAPRRDLGLAIVVREQGHPAFPSLTQDERLGRLPLRIERTELLFQTFLGRFPSVDRTPEPTGWLTTLGVQITVSHAAAPFDSFPPYG
jgi:hypothetical protein